MLQRSLLHIAAACIFSLSGLTVSSALADDMAEYAVKAGNIGNIIGFITWPSGKTASKESKAEVCILGDNQIISIAGAIQKKYPQIILVKEGKINNVVLHCDALFIGIAELDEYKDALNVLKNKPVLTISDSPDFIERGGMVMLAYQGGRIKPVINNSAIERAKLSADPLMLETFKVVND